MLFSGWATRSAMCAKGRERESRIVLEKEIVLLELMIAMSILTLATSPFFYVYVKVSLMIGVLLDYWRKNLSVTLLRFGWCKGRPKTYKYYAHVRVNIATSHMVPDDAQEFVFNASSAVFILMIECLCLIQFVAFMNMLSMIFLVLHCLHFFIYSQLLFAQNNKFYIPRWY